jgi:hypothetical protein
MNDDTLKWRENMTEDMTTCLVSVENYREKLINQETV